MKRVLNVLAVILVVAIVIGMVGIVAGCDGIGGLGGQGIVINVYQNAPEGGMPGSIPVTLPSPMPLTELTENSKKDIPVTAGNYSTIDIEIIDGGTLTGNPSVGKVPVPVQTATTQPSN